MLIDCTLKQHDGLLPESQFYVPEEVRQGTGRLFYPCGVTLIRFILAFGK